MGCHTWFYYKLDPQPIYEDVKNNVLKKQIYFDINFYNSILNDTMDKEYLEENPELTKEYAFKKIQVVKRKERMIKNNLCREAVCKKFKYRNELTKYISGRGFYISTHELTHDLFRIGDYDQTKLFSYEETMKFIENNRNKIYYFHNTWKEDMIDFWKTYTDGMICFG